VKKFAPRFERRSRGSLAVAIAIHLAVGLLLLQMVFRYPLGQLMGLSEPETQEHLQYGAVPHSENSGGRRALTPPKDQTPAALRAPRITPSAITIPSPKIPVAAQAAGASGTGFGVTGNGLATGIVPQTPDSRIALVPGPIVRVPRTVAEDVDSIMSLAIGIVNDSIAYYQRLGKTPEWIKKTADGKEWGLTKDYIALGKYKIPTALLALLPLNGSSAMSPIEQRTANYIRRDVQENGQRSMSEDEFRTAVKRIRERKEKERKQQQLASGQKDKDKGQVP
jgi:hypothetical protein